MDEPLRYYAFEVLYWCGIRYGELRALMVEDFDFDNNILRINKSHYMPQFLADEMKDYIKSFYHIGTTDRF